MTTHLTILTGGSRGMGLALAQQRLAPGHTLISLARQANPTLQPPSGATLEQWCLDLSDGANAAARLRAWLERQSPTAYASATLINNAGVIPRLAPLSDSAGDTDQASLANALRVGLEAPMLLTAAFLSATQAWQDCPRKVLNISSGAAHKAMASQAAYCAAKAGLDHFTRCLALEEAAKPHGAKVCSLAPGVIDTDMQVHLRSANPADFRDVGRFAALHSEGVLFSPTDAAARVLAWLGRTDFGAQPVADVRQG